MMPPDVMEILRRLRQQSEMGHGSHLTAGESRVLVAHLKAMNERVDYLEEAVLQAEYEAEVSCN